MALSGGHWENYAELIKLTQPTLIGGVVEEDVKRGNPFTLFPLVQANHTGEKVMWLRESVTAEADVADLGIGGQTLMSESVTYSQKEAALKMCYLYRKLDKFVPAIHGTFNKYEEMVAREMIRGLQKRAGDKVIYDDITYGSALQMDGLHAMAAESFGQAWDIDAAETALSLEKWRALADEMKHGVDFWLVPFWLPRYLGAAFQEKGFAGLATATAGTMGDVSWGVNQAGAKITYFCNAPMIPSDFLVEEQANTGISTNKRAKKTSGTAQYSLFGVKLGKAALAEEDPGFKLLFGKTEADGQIFDLEYFEKLENFKAKAMRMSLNLCGLNGSAMAIGRIWDFTKAAPTV